MSAPRPVLPGEHPHADRPNWRPAETLEQYVANVHEGLEELSDRRILELTGWSRVYLCRMRAAGYIPADLFERLIGVAGHVPTLRELATISRLLSGDAPPAAVERCPCCGHVLRARRSISAEAERVVDAWLRERAVP
jgi:hypothetical protein